MKMSHKATGWSGVCWGQLDQNGLSVGRVWTWPSTFGIP